MFARPIGPDAELRPLEERHAEALFAAVDANRAHLRRWLPWLDANASAEDSRAFVRSSLARFARGDGFDAGVFVGGEIAGVAGLHFVNRAHRSTEIGYWLAARFEGRGLVTRACEALIEHAFLELGLNRVALACATGHARSCAVAERLGFAFEGVTRDAEWLYDRFVDHRRYGLLEREWRERGAG